MVVRSRLIPFFSLCCTLFSRALAEASFENTAIARMVEVGGSLVHVRTTYAIKALKDGSSTYTFALGKDEGSKTNFLEARIKGQPGTLDLKPFGFSSESNAFLYAVELPYTLSVNGISNLEVDSVQTHATYPWPPTVAQDEEQFLKYETELFVLSPYRTLVQRTKIRTANANNITYTTPKGVEEFTSDAPVTRVGTTITYGPYNNIPPSSNLDFTVSSQKRVTIHYPYDDPVVAVTTYKRAAEISHWGANLNIQDEIHLHNAGPKLRGHFSRLQHQMQAYRQRPAKHVLYGFNLHLPAGIHDAYYYDLVGNVSTSRLRTAPSVPKGAPTRQFSVLELRPRYPLMGGWNYSFTLGWDSPLQDSASWDAQTGRYIVAVPIMSQFPGAVIDEAEVKVILPEGATDIEIVPPFPPKSMTRSTHTTYLDTIGRPEITFEYSQLTDKHAGVIYVAYKVPFSAHLRKPFAVVTAFFGLFTLALGARRIDGRIHK